MKKTDITLNKTHSINKKLLASITVSFLFIVSLAFAQSNGTWANKYQKIKGKWSIFKRVKKYFKR